MSEMIDIVFDGPPGPVAPRFVETERPNGQGVNVGEWIMRDDGYWVLRLLVDVPSRTPRPAPRAPEESSQ